MAKMARQRNGMWEPPNEWQYVNLQLLMDIRDELQTLNSIMRCPNVQAGFRALTRISRQHDVAFKRRVEAAVAKRKKRASR